MCSLSTEYSGDDNGTAFWRSKITGEEHIAKDFNYRQMGEHSGFIPHGETLLDPSSVTINNWERYYLAKHEYNTMVMYEGNVCTLHTLMRQSGVATVQPSTVFSTKYLWNVCVFLLL